MVMKMQANLPHNCIELAFLALRIYACYLVTLLKNCDVTNKLTCNTQMCYLLATLAFNIATTATNGSFQNSQCLYRAVKQAELTSVFA